MGLRTTCIGAYPKPDYIPLQDWFQLEGGLSHSSGEVTRLASQLQERDGDELEQLYQRATAEAVADQIACGIDIPTDGEQRRENYIHYHCRHLNGFDFSHLTARTLRDGAYTAELPTIRGKIEPRAEHFLDRDFQSAQKCSDRPIKITLPGPITIIDTSANEYYESTQELAYDLAAALNYEVQALVAAGCKHIQIDEPLFVRDTSRALSFGVECLDRCFAGVPDDVTRISHMCCGYPDHLDDRDYHKADPNCYFELAAAIERSSVQQISIEDTHRRNDLSLLEQFQSTTVILGSVAIAESRVEPVEEIAARLTQALQHIDRDRLIVAPDCGLAMLGRELAMAKLRNMTAAAATA